MTFRKARLQDVDAIMALVQRRIDWMNRVGLHQWNETDYFGRYPRAYWERNIGRFRVGVVQGRVVVAIALYDEDVRWTRDGHYTGTATQGNSPLTTPHAPLATSATPRALYLHHLVTDPDHAGAGRKMMLHIERYAASHGIHLLRLDSAVGNSVLERYYTELGYSACGTCHDQLYHGVLREKMI